MTPPPSACSSRTPRGPGPRPRCPGGARGRRPYRPAGSPPQVAQAPPELGSGPAHRAGEHRAAEHRQRGEAADVVRHLVRPLPRQGLRPNWSMFTEASPRRVFTLASVSKRVSGAPPLGVPKTCASLAPAPAWSIPSCVEVSCSWSCQRCTRGPTWAGRPTPAPSVRGCRRWTACRTAWLPYARCSRSTAAAAGSGAPASADADAWRRERSASERSPAACLGLFTLVIAADGNTDAYRPLPPPMAHCRRPFRKRGLGLEGNRDNEGGPRGGGSSTMCPAGRRLPPGGGFPLEVPPAGRPSGGAA